MVANGACYLAADAGAIILVPCHVVKSLQLRWNVRVHGLITVTS